jgi:type IV secretory pathway VirB10-like protein
MKSSGQRQDVAFLALAVAILAIAVAIFVGVRALSSRKAGKKAAEPQPVAQQPKPEPPKPTGAVGHDPFKEKPAAPASPPAVQKQPEPEEGLRLVGIIAGKEPLAVIRRGDRRYYAKRGDRVAGFAVVEIGSGRAVLVKDSAQLTLLLHEPPGEKEGQR